MVDLTRRQIALLKKITGRKSIKTGELLARFDMSRETLRKELVELEHLGLIARFHGKIVSVDSPENTALLESSGLLSKAKRKDQILHMLKENKEMRISTLAAKLHVSTITARNDLSELEMEGAVVRKHGSVALMESSVIPKTGNVIQGYSARTRMLGQHTLMHIHPGETVFLDGGEISRFVAASIPPYSNIPIVTNSMAIIDTLRERHYAYPIYILPGIFSPGTGRILLYQDHPSVHVDKAFITSTSYANHTFFLDENEDPFTIDQICSLAERVYIVLDSSFLDLQRTHLFDYRQYRSKIQEMLVDDGIGHYRANLLFSRRDPVVICGNNYAYRNASRQRHQIGFLVNQDRNYFVQAVHNSLLEATAACDSVSLTIMECDGSYASTVSNLNTLLLDNVDLVIDFSLCMESLMFVGERCRSRGIRLISVDLMAPGAIYFGADNALAGKIAGEKALEFINTRWSGKLDNLMVLENHGYDPITKLRISNALECIEQQISLPSEHICTIEWGHPDGNPTQNLIKILRETPKDESMLIMAFNLKHLLAAYDYIVQYRNFSNTIIVGQNHTKQIEELMKIKDSPIIGCVQYNPEQYGERILELAMRILDDVAVEPQNYTQLAWIAKEQVVNGSGLPENCSR